jgi:Tfp pilus assembly protein PilO
MLNSCDLQILQLMFEDIQKYPNHLYWLIAFSFAILFIFILFIGYIAYIKGKNSEKGKIDARLKLLDSLVHEQSKIVEAVEVIKSNIEKGIWLEKERNAIKRQKIDEMMSNLSKIHPYLFKQLGELDNVKIFL